MDASDTVTILNTEGLAAFARESAQDSAQVRKLRLGPAATRAQHTGTKPWEIGARNSPLLARLIRSLPDLDCVECCDLRWSPIDVASLLPAATSPALVYAVRQVAAAKAGGGESEVAADAQDRTEPLAFPKNDVVGRAAGGDIQGQSDVRVVKVYSATHDAASGAARSAAGVGEFRETLVHVSDATTAAAGGVFLSAVGAAVFDLTLKWSDLSRIWADTAAHNLNVTACTSLSSLTLTYTLRPGASSTTYAQWLLNIAVLRGVAPCLRRLRLVVEVAEEGGCKLTWEQVKRTRWQDLAIELARFSDFEKVEVVVAGEGADDSEIWQEIELRLRGTLPRGVHLIQGRFVSCNVLMTGCPKAVPAIIPSRV